MLMPDLPQLGLNPRLQKEFESLDIDFPSIARVIKEHKELYEIQNDVGIFKAEITGNMRFMAESRRDYPAVGDWVEVTVFDDNQAIIHRILPRFSLLERQSVGTYSEKQLIATNIDKAFIVQSVDRDFNLNRLDRYFVIAHNGDIIPVILLNKVDLISKRELEVIKQKVTERLPDALVFMTSTITGDGLQELMNFLQRGETYCFLGSSGVGKTSIINYLAGEDKLYTKEISDATKKGKHATTRRELLLLDNGSILIDTPGMREIGMTESGHGLEITFNQIVELAKECKFTDCSHTDEPGCKILEAIEAGLVSDQELLNYKKLERQSMRFSESIAEKRKKDKSFGKMIKEIMKTKKKNK